MMIHITLIDDDPTEALLLEGMLEHVEGAYRMTHLKCVEDFDGLDAQAAPDLVLLDRRIPPHDAFDTSLPVLAANGYRGPVVLMSASEFAMPGDHHGLTITAPINKSQLLTPQAVDALLKRAITPA